MTVIIFPVQREKFVASEPIMGLNFEVLSINNLSYRNYNMNKIYDIFIVYLLLLFITLILKIYQLTPFYYILNFYYYITNFFNLNKNL